MPPLYQSDDSAGLLRQSHLGMPSQERTIPDIVAVLFDWLTRPKDD